MINFFGETTKEPIQILLIICGFITLHFLFYELLMHFLDLDSKYIINIMIGVLCLMLINEFFFANELNLPTFLISINEHKLNILYLIGISALIRIRNRLD